MTDGQITKIGKLLKLMSLSKPTEVNMDIYVHGVSKETAKKIMKGMPKCFRRTTKITDSGSNWREALKSSIYGLNRIGVTVFYPKVKGGE